MKRFVITVVALKLALITGFLTLFIFSQATVQKGDKVVATPTPAFQPDDNINRSTSEPYTGALSIFEDADRAKKLQIDRVMDILQITDKSNVADIGAASGWFTVRAAKRIGTGTVFAVEINQEYIDHINKRAATEKLPNIETVLGKPNDPMLAANSVDAVMILKTYHEIAEPIAFLRNLRKATRKGGLVAIIDKDGDGDDHGLDADSVIAEAKRAGFSLKEKHTFVKDGMDYFLVFSLAGSGAGK